MIECKLSGAEVNHMFDCACIEEDMVGEHWADGTRVMYRVTIKEWRDGRSTGKDSQNNHIWGHVRDIVRAGLGSGSVETTSVALVDLAVDSGQYPVEFILGRAVAKRLSELDSKEAAEFIEFLHRFAGEWGVELTEKEWE
jgi:hypothetical protein